MNTIVDGLFVAIACAGIALGTYCAGYGLAWLVDIVVRYLIGV